MIVPLTFTRREDLRVGGKLKNFRKMLYRSEEVEYFVKTRVTMQMKLLQAHRQWGLGALLSIIYEGVV